MAEINITDESDYINIYSVAERGWVQNVLACKIPITFHFVQLPFSGGTDHKAEQPHRLKFRKSLAAHFDHVIKQRVVFLQQHRSPPCDEKGNKRKSFPDPVLRAGSQRCSRLQRGTPAQFPQPDLF